MKFICEKQDEDDMTDDEGQDSESIYTELQGITDLEEMYKKVTGKEEPKQEEAKDEEPAGE